MSKTKLYLAGDHASVELKSEILEFVKSLGFDAVDLGTNSKESVDYPDFANALAKEILKDKENGLKSFGILICGTGIGISIAANRHPFLRCALSHNSTTAKLAREHNDANVLAFGARVVGLEVAKDMVEVFLKTEFLGGRHQKRVDKLSTKF